MANGSTEPQDFARLKLIDAEALSTLWGVKKSWIYDQVEAGALPAVRLGRQLRFHEQHLIGYLESRSAQADPKH